MLKVTIELPRFSPTVERGITFWSEWRGRLYPLQLIEGRLYSMAGPVGLDAAVIVGYRRSSESDYARRRANELAHGQDGYRLATHRRLRGPVSGKTRKACHGKDGAR